MHWIPELAYFPCLLNLKRRHSNCFSQSQSLGRSLYLFSRDGRLGFFYITCYVSDQGKSASFLSEFKTLLRWLQELGIWERYLITITEFYLGHWHYFLCWKHFFSDALKQTLISWGWHEHLLNKFENTWGCILSSLIGTRNVSSCYKSFINESIIFESKKHTPISYTVREWLKTRLSLSSHSCSTWRCNCKK